MTNTIPNVPRELLERAAYTLELAYEVDTPTVRDLRALLSAPSPAGVDGLEVMAWVTTGFSGKSRTRRAFTVNADDAARQHTNWTPHYRQVTTDQLCRLSDAQAIIDGLRGENERIRLNIAEYNEAISCYQSERDQQAQRIGELEGLLRHAQKQVPTGSGLHMRIDAALSAGKEG